MTLSTNTNNHKEMLNKGTLPNMYKGVVRIGYPYNTPDSGILHNQTCVGI